MALDEAAVAPITELFVALDSCSWRACLRPGGRKPSRCTRSGSRMNPEVDRVVRVLGPLGWGYSSTDLTTRVVWVVEDTTGSPAVASRVGQVR